MARIMPQMARERVLPRVADRARPALVHTLVPPHDMAEDVAREVARVAFLLLADAAGGGRALTVCVVEAEVDVPGRADGGDGGADGAWEVAVAADGGGGGVLGDEWSGGRGRGARRGSARG